MKVSNQTNKQTRKEKRKDDLLKKMDDIPFGKNILPPMDDALII